MQLGGKNAGIIFDDADLSKVIPAAINSCFLNQGEICLCTSRIFVHRSLYQEFLQRFVQETKYKNLCFTALLLTLCNLLATTCIYLVFSALFEVVILYIHNRNLKVGPPTEDVFMGPLASKSHLEKVLSYIHKARAEGGRILCGETVDEFYLPPTYSKVRHYNYS